MSLKRIQTNSNRISILSLKPYYVQIIQKAIARDFRR